jgi:hypothetical protein
MKKPSEKFTTKKILEKKEGDDDRRCYFEENNMKDLNHSIYEGMEENYKRKSYYTKKDKKDRRHYKGKKYISNYNSHKYIHDHNERHIRKSELIKSNYPNGNSSKTFHEIKHDLKNKNETSYKRFSTQNDSYPIQNQYTNSPSVNLPNFINFPAFAHNYFLMNCMKSVYFQNYLQPTLYNSNPKCEAFSSSYFLKNYNNSYDPMSELFAQRKEENGRNDQEQQDPLIIKKTNMAENSIEDKIYNGQEFQGYESIQRTKYWLPQRSCENQVRLNKLDEEDLRENLYYEEFSFNQKEHVSLSDSKGNDFKEQDDNECDILEWSIHSNDTQFS